MDLTIAPCFFNGMLKGLKMVKLVNYCYFVCIFCKRNSFFKSRITPSNYNNFFIGKKITVACGTVGNTPALEAVFPVTPSVRDLPPGVRIIAFDE